MARKKTARVCISDLLRVKQDNQGHGPQEEPERTGARQAWREGTGGELVRCGNHHDCQQGRESKGKEANRRRAAPDCETRCRGPRTQEKGDKLMRNRQQHGKIIRIGAAGMCAIGIAGTSPATSSGSVSLIGSARLPHGENASPADIVSGAEWHMATVNSGTTLAERESLPSGILPSGSTSRGLSNINGPRQRRAFGTSGKIISNRSPGKCG
jgi:hypothetical protein